MPPRQPAAKPFVWGGVALSIPSHWETGRLEAGYALLEAGLRPVMEFKTAAIRGRFSLRRHMKQLDHRGHATGGLAVTAMPWPRDWPPFPETADIQAFQWQGTTVGGRGLLHFCRMCRRATLLQFYTYADGVFADDASVLASFRDHGGDVEGRLAVYDIAAALPERLPLTVFHFAAGRFELVFGRPRGEQVTLWRLSPAQILLERCGRDLKAVARNNGLLPAEAPVNEGQASGDGMEWHWYARGLGPRLKAIWRRGDRRATSALRIWQPPGSNRLLAVRAERLQRREDFEKICGAYGVL